MIISATSLSVGASIKKGELFMGASAKQLIHIDRVKEIISLALSHFDRKGLDVKKVDQLSIAANLTFSDRVFNCRC